MILRQAEDRLGCFDFAHAIGPDDTDELTGTPTGDFRITSVTPSAGTAVSRTEPISVHVTPVDPAEPAALEPCSWLTSDQAAKALGSGGVTTAPAGDERGSVSPSCGYKAGSRLLTVVLDLPGAYPVSAASSFALERTPEGGAQVTSVSGVGSQAACVVDAQSTTLFVLLPRERILSVVGWDGAGCDTLTDVARTAASRVG
ncbi:hypothetical protein [Tsukamurella soli]